MSERSMPDSESSAKAKKKPRASNPIVLNTKSKPLTLPEFETHTLVRVDGLWAVLSLRIKDRTVADYSMTEGDIMPVTMDKLVRKIIKAVRGK